MYTLLNQSTAPIIVVVCVRCATSVMKVFSMILENLQEIGASEKYSVYSNFKQ